MNIISVIWNIAKNVLLPQLDQELNFPKAFVTLVGMHEIEKIIRNAKEILNSRSKIIINNEIEFNSETNAKNFWLDTNKLNNLGFIKKFSLEETIKDITK